MRQSSRSKPSATRPLPAAGDDGDRLRHRPSHRRWALGCCIWVLGGLGSTSPLIAVATGHQHPAEYVKALDLIHEFNGVGNELERVAALAAQLQRSNPKSGYALVIAAEMMSTIDLGRSNDPEAVGRQVIAMADRALAMDPTLAQAHVAKARVLLAMQAEDAALAEVDQALEIEPGNVGALFVLARSHWRMLRIDEAVALYGKIIATVGNPIRKANAYDWMARMFEDAARRDWQQRKAYVDKAREAFERSTALSPGGAWHQVNYAVLLNGLAADFVAAERQAGKALAIMEFPMARLQLAAARYQQLWAREERQAPASLKEQVERIAVATQVNLDEASNSRAVPHVARARLKELKSRLP